MKNEHDLSDLIHQHLKPILESYDKDKNAGLEKEELRQLLADNLGTTPDKITQDQLDWHFERIDQNKDGTITFEEYFQHFWKQRAQAAIKNLDKKPKVQGQKSEGGNNEDELIDLNEFRKLMQDTFKPLNIKITQQMVQWNFNQIDKDHSGRISFDEFLKFIRKYNN